MDVVFTLIGGSCIKLVYSLGEKVKTEDSVVIRMTTFAADQLEESMLFLKERFGGDVGRGQTVFTTGVGCHVNSEFINSTLNIRSVESPALGCTDCILCNHIVDFQHWVWGFGTGNNCKVENCFIEISSMQHAVRGC